MIRDLRKKKWFRMLAIITMLIFLLTGAVVTYAVSGKEVIIDGEPSDIIKGGGSISYSTVDKDNKKEVPQKMMPGSVIIYDSRLRPKVVKGGYMENEIQQSVETEDSIKDSILKCLKLVPITDDMTAAEKELI